MSAIAPTTGSKEDIHSKDHAPLAVRQLTKAERRAAIFTGRIAVNVYRIVFIAVFLVGWQLISGHGIPELFISKPSIVAVQLVDFLRSSSGWLNIRVTAEEYGWGLLIGVSSGTIAAIVLSSFRILGRVFEPIVAALNAVPIIALAPLFIIFFGLGIWSKVSISSIAVFFIMFWNLYIGIKNLSPTLENVLRVFGANRMNQIRYAVIPAVVPSLFAGLRLSVAIAMIGSLVGEFVASTAGLGHYIETESEVFATAGTLVGIILAVAIVLLCRGLVILGERHMTRWQRDGVI